MYSLGNCLIDNQVNTQISINSLVSPLCGQNNESVSCISAFEKVYISNNPGIEQQLNVFISWVLRVTSTGEYSGIAAMELLDQAWTAQKLVWWLRESQNG
jgi:hypothetical protein